MRAARYYAPGDIRIDDIDEPDPGPGQVKIEVSYNGICGSDLHEYYTAPMMVPCSEPHPLTGVVAPVVLGHESGGVVVAVGDGVDDLELGTLVAVEPIKRCRMCPNCVAGRYNLCDNMAFNGYSTGHGGLAEYNVVDRDMAHVLPAGMTPMEAALVEPMSVAHRAVQRAGLVAGDVAVVHGAGPIGLGAALALRHMGVTVIVSDPSPDRRAIVEQFDGMSVIDPVGDPTTAILDLTGGRGAAASIEAAGATASFETSLMTTAKGGSIVLVAIHHEPVPLFTPLLFRGEIDLRVSTAYCGDFPNVIAAMSDGAYPLLGWVTSIPMSRLIEDGFEQLQQGRAVKILVDPTG